MSDNLIKASAAAKQLGKSSTTIHREYTTVDECRHGLDAFFERYNNRREHQSLDNYPREVYFNQVGANSSMIMSHT